MLRIGLTVLAVLVLLVLSAIAALFLAGAHTGILPQSLDWLGFILGWGMVIFVPLFGGRWVWRRLAPKVG